MAGHVATVLLVITLLPRASAAQTFVAMPGDSSFHGSIAGIAGAHASLLSRARQPDKPARSPLSRRAWIALGTGIGFGGGMVFGEYYFGRHLDMPHGPDMVMGGAIGAGAGAVIAWLVTRNQTTRTAERWPTAATREQQRFASRQPFPSTQREGDVQRDENGNRGADDESRQEGPLHHRVESGAVEKRD